MTASHPDKLTVDEVHQMAESADIWAEDEVRAALKVCALSLIEAMNKAEQPYKQSYTDQQTIVTNNEYPLPSGPLRMRPSKTSGDSN